LELEWLALLGSGEPREARFARLAALLEALPEAPQRAEGLLLALQLAVALGHTAQVDRWLQEASQLATQVALDGHSLLVLCLLAGAPQASPDAQAVLEAGAERALLALAEGQLAWPAPEDAFAAGVDGPEWLPDPKRALLEQRLTALLGPERRAALAGPLARLADHRERQGAAFAALGPLPAIPLAQAAPPARWQPLLERGPSWWWRPTLEEPIEIACLPAAALLEPLARAAAADGYGFEIESPGAAAAPGAFTGETFELSPGLGPLRLLHRDPRRSVRAALSQSLPVQAGAGLLAALVLVAAGLGARALRRGRRLAELETRFVAGISHDLRTPLASILLISESLAAGEVPLATSGPRYFAALKREAERLRRRVDDLLDFSRLRRGLGPRLSPEPVRLAPLLGELESELREECERANVTLEWRVLALPEELVIDPDALRRSLSNLVANALRHSGSTSLQVEFDGNPRGLSIEVADRGRGIPRADQERVFQPFVQIAGHGSEKGGSGLGLTIVRELARAHGGEAELVEQAGPGTRIRLWLKTLESP
jgi:signal transduction histidine kinase